MRTSQKTNATQPASGAVTSNPLSTASTSFEEQAASSSAVRPNARARLSETIAKLTEGVAALDTLNSTSNFPEQSPNSTRGAANNTELNTNEPMGASNSREPQGGLNTTLPPVASHWNLCVWSGILAGAGFLIGAVVGWGCAGYTLRSDANRARDLDEVFKSSSAKSRIQYFRDVDVGLDKFTSSKGLEKKYDFVESVESGQISSVDRNAAADIKGYSIKLQRGEKCEMKNADLTRVAEAVQELGKEMQSKLNTCNAALESKGKELESKNKALEGKEAQLESKNKELESKETELETKTKSLETCTTTLEANAKALKQASSVFTACQVDMKGKECLLELASSLDSFVPDSTVWNKVDSDVNAIVSQGKHDADEAVSKSIKDYSNRLKKDASSKLEKADDLPGVASAVEELGKEIQSKLNTCNSNLKDNAAKLKQASNNFEDCQVDAKGKECLLQLASSLDSLVSRSAAKDKLDSDIDAIVSQSKNDADATFARSIKDYSNRLKEDANAKLGEARDLPKVASAVQDLGKTMQSKFNSCSDNLDTKKAELESKDKELESKDAELETKTKSLGTCTTELKSKKAELESKSKELESKVTELESKETELETKTKSLGTCTTELESKKAELETKTKSLGTCTTELKSKKAELESKSKELESKVTELESKETELETKTKSLETCTTELKSKKAELESKETELETKTKSLETCTTALEGHTKALKQGSSDFKGCQVDVKGKECLLKLASSLDSLLPDNAVRNKLDSDIDAIVSQSKKDADGTVARSIKDYSNRLKKDANAKLGEASDLPKVVSAVQEIQGKFNKCERAKNHANSELKKCQSDLQEKQTIIKNAHAVIDKKEDLTNDEYNNKLINALYGDQHDQANTMGAVSNEETGDEL